ncbi:hypothetical protein N665_1526s0003 [Sinapis alba]|nr:hypothetical protein N665_1526s0003 [Sinapis alba]
MEVGSTTKLQCQRIGCNAMFTGDDNPDGSCQFHASPFFHDGMKEWSCCKQRSHDFTLCKKGIHTTEKPVLAKPSPRQPITVPTSSPVANAATKDSCSRCRQGFFCSDHGSQPKEQIRQALNTPAQAQEEEIETLAPPPPVKKRDNHETACSYHPGPAVFHDRLRGWKCCDVHVKEFDEFMEIPPCTKGWHSSIYIHVIFSHDIFLIIVRWNISFMDIQYIYND